MSKKKLYIDEKPLEKNDIGRLVVYNPPIAGNKEIGEITSWNDSYVFVKFKYNAYGVACRAKNLSFTTDDK